MMFLCLCYYDTKRFSELTPADFEAIPAACKPHDEALHRSGRLALLGSLTEPEQARSLRESNGSQSIAEGAFLPGQEQIGAFFVVDAESLEQATQVAALHPGARLSRYFGGGIEVRACEIFETYPPLQGGSSEAGLR